MNHLLVVLILTAVMVMMGITSAAGDGRVRHPMPHPVPITCTAQGFKPFSAAVWGPKAWERGNPPQNVLEAVRRRLSCAPGPHRQVMKKTWAQDRSDYFSHRRQMLWREKYKPFVYPDGSHWAVPYPIAICESGENYYAGPSGAYGEIPPLPQYQSPRAQDEIAHRLYVESGDGPWAPYESGCYLR